MSKRLIFYPAGVFEEKNTGSYSIYFSDFPKIKERAQTLTEACDKAQLVLQEVIKNEVKNKRPLPVASTIEEAKEKFKVWPNEEGLGCLENGSVFYVSAPISLLYGLGPVYDSTYKAIFTQKEAFRDLLRYFVDQKISGRVNYNLLETQKENFVTSQFREIRDDVIWRLTTNDNHSFYVYLLTEFQSKDYFYMVARMAEYVAEERMNIIHSGAIKHGERLPVIIPIVLYRGVKPWTAPTTLEGIQIPVDKSLSEFSQESYILIDIHRLAIESLSNRKSIPSILFRMERANSWDELKAILKEACIYFKGEHYKKIRDTFLHWSKCVGMPRFTIPPDQFSSMNSLEELSGMGYAYADKEEEEYYTKWRRDLEKKAYDDGNNEGKKEDINMLAAKGMKIDQIAYFFDMPLNEISKILNTNT
ncbi:MAG: Rpn family recombination-promoting nuclease/putative transposase [Desulfovibrionaceae bacterium]|nr:Rpn family recombination-promoting nuclease/putative transposase [Desulfovibrionaceae bacterium]